MRRVRFLRIRTALGLIGVIGTSVLVALRADATVRMAYFAVLSLLVLGSVLALINHRRRRRP
jgi:hypothetical protein